MQLAEEVRGSNPGLTNRRHAESENILIKNGQGYGFLVGQFANKKIAIIDLKKYVKLLSLAFEFSRITKSKQHNEVNLNALIIHAPVPQSKMHQG